MMPALIVYILCGCATLFYERNNFYAFGDESHCPLLDKIIQSIMCIILFPLLWVHYASELIRKIK